MISDGEIDRLVGVIYHLPEKDVPLLVQADNCSDLLSYMQLNVWALVLVSGLVCIAVDQDSAVALFRIAGFGKLLCRRDFFHL
jgi:hypothetical protein